MLVLYSICNLWDTSLCFYCFQDAILVSFMLLLYSKCNLWVIYILLYSRCNVWVIYSFTIYWVQSSGHLWFYYIQDGIFGSFMLYLYSRCNSFVTYVFTISNVHIWITYALPIFKMQSFCHICFYYIQGAIFRSLMLDLCSRCNLFVTFDLLYTRCNSWVTYASTIFKVQYFGNLCFTYIQDAIFLSHMLLLYSRCNL